MIAAGISELPTMGDGRQSGTSSSPSILNASPESVAGGNLALLETGDIIRFDFNNSRVELKISDAELANRRAAYRPPDLINGSPWEELFESTRDSFPMGRASISQPLIRIWVLARCDTVIEVGSRKASVHANIMNSWSDHVARLTESMWREITSNAFIIDI
ncbi:MAG: dihydroxy-acid dehydratase [Pirellulaceae bacterium]